MDNTELEKRFDELSKKHDNVLSANKVLLNRVESLTAKNEVLTKTVQTLKNEINRLKGEKGKPDFPPSKKDNDNKDHSSEKERKKPKNADSRKEKMKKTDLVFIDREEDCELNKEDLPNDLIFKGYEYVTVQDLRIVTDNIRFKREVYYSPSLRKTFTADLPPGYHGEFGPGIHSLTLTLNKDSKMTQPAIKRFFNTFKISIAASTISRYLTDGHESFHQEKEDIIDAGLQSTSYQHLDDTGAKVNGENYYTHVLCSPWYTAFFTRSKKDRLTILSFLCRTELKFVFNEDSYQLMLALGLPEKSLLRLKALTALEVMTRTEIDAVLIQLYHNPKKQRTNRHRILEAAAIVYYQSLPCAITQLVCDDAPQFNRIAEHKVLCWVHIGRHFKKLNPVMALHREYLDDFLDKFWTFYKELLTYKQAPTQERGTQLSEQFDVLFSTVTGYDDLDERIAKTFTKKSSLLLVLLFPFLPLHNNPAELGARVQARSRDINLQTKNDKGTQAQDTFNTIVETAKKQCVNIYNYIYDRITQQFKMPSLASLILEKSQPPKLDFSSA